MQQCLNGAGLHALFESGYRNLKKNTDAINALNVFPVPDGDTGTNMVMTFGGGLRSVSSELSHVGEYMQRLSQAVLLSARGNSGVIFSQFVYGLYRGFARKETVTFADLSDAFACAREDAYKAILTPTEGTILTVIREAAEFLSRNSYSDFLPGMEALLAQMKDTLRRTPELLPVLKESGVVDSGGAGLVCFVEGMVAHLNGKTVEDTPELAQAVAQPVLTGSFGPDSALEYGYCTEFILQLMHAKTNIESFDLQSFLKPLESMGDSIVAVVNGSIVKLHIHTFTPEAVLEYGRRFGEFVTLKIENMSVQHSETPAESQPEAPREHMKYAVVAVAAGEGIKDYFLSIGANGIIDGGQTNNPPVDAFLEAFRKLDAEHIIVLPDNSNVVLTARQAAELYPHADVQVIPTKSIVEGCSALSMFNPWCETVEMLVEEMSAGLNSVTTGYLTTAIRDAAIGGLQVKTGDYIGLDRETILTRGENKVDTALSLVREITDRGCGEIIIVFRGAGVTDEEAADFEQRLRAAYPCADIGFIDGKQEVYDFILSVE